MKKTLLSLATVAMAASSFAAVEVGFIDSAALGLANKPTLSSMTQLAHTESVDMYLAAGQEVSQQNPSFQGMNTIVVNGEEIPLVTGIGGTTNGNARLDGISNSEGCMYQFDVKENGWLIVVSKISSNKNVYVFRGTADSDHTAYAYTLGMSLHSADYEMSEIKYSLPANSNGTLDLEAVNIDEYTFGSNAIAWPIRIATQNADAASAGNGTGAVIFPVKVGYKYTTLVSGSKMNTCGFIFVDGDPTGNAPAVSVKGVLEDGTEKVVVITSEGSAVEGIEAAEFENADAPVYNMMGVRVNADAKGILIQNGKKFIRK